MMKADTDFRYRYLVTLLVTLSSCVSYMNRNQINIAIVDMVDNAPIMAANSINSSSSHTVVYCEKIHVQNASTSKHDDVQSTPTMPGQRYDWSESTQGQVLGSFYYSYIIFQMPTGILTENYGGRWIIVACLLGSGIISLVTPVVASLHVAALMSLRVLLGIIQAGFFPAGFGLLCQWLPLSERSTGFALLNAGAAIGSSIPAFISGPLINQYGWSSMFYVTGTVSVSMAIIFAILVYSKPNNHPFVSKTELMTIREGVVNEPNVTTTESTAAANSSAGVSIPWRKILINKAVLSLALFQFSCFWIVTILSTSLPKYLDEILAFDISTNGVINGILQWLSVIPLTLFGFISEIIIQKGWISRTSTRKLFSLLTGSAVGAAVLLVPAAGCNPTTLIVIVFVASFLCGFTSASDTAIPSEMTNHFPAAVFAFLNMVSTSAGFITPAFVGGILQGMPGDAWNAWSLVFYVSGALMIASNVVFLIFAAAERQSFDFVD